MAVAPHNDDDIRDEDVIIRRVNPDQHVIYDEISQVYRTSSKLFTPSSSQDGGMSVDLLRPIESDGRDAREFVTTPVFTGSVKFLASAARDSGLRLGKDPLPDNPYHGEVWGPEGRPSKFSKGEKRALERGSTWYVELPGVKIGP